MYIDEGSMTPLNACNENRFLTLVNIIESKSNLDTDEDSCSILWPTLYISSTASESLWSASQLFGWARRGFGFFLRFSASIISWTFSRVHFKQSFMPTYCICAFVEMVSISHCKFHSVPSSERWTLGPWYNCDKSPSTYTLHVTSEPLPSGLYNSFFKYIDCSSNHLPGEHCKAAALGLRRIIQQTCPTRLFAWLLRFISPSVGSSWGHLTSPGFHPHYFPSQIHWR